MIVGVFGGQKYFKLKNVDWTNEITDWEELDFVKQTYVDREKPKGEMNGINKVFELSKTPITNSEHIYLNGMLQESGDDYLIDGKKITLFLAPFSDWKIRCS